MGKYGMRRVQVLGKLVNKPILEKNEKGFEKAVMVLEVTESPTKKDEPDRVSIVVIEAIMFDAQNIARYGKVGAFYYVEGIPKSREWEGKYYTDLQATKIRGGW